MEQSKQIEETKQKGLIKKFEAMQCDSDEEGSLHDLSSDEEVAPKGHQAAKLPGLTGLFNGPLAAKNTVPAG